MDVFVIGGTRVLGQPVVRLLIQHGHRVRGLARSQEAAQTLRNLGAEPVTADLFDPASLRGPAGEADAVLHLATRIPPTNRMRHASAWEENDRIRREGTRHLVDAALAGRAQAFVYTGITFVYPDSGDRWIDAATVEPQARAFTRSTLDAEAEVARFAAAGRRGVSLRMGAFYGPSSPQTQEMLAYARRGFAPYPGRGSAYVSSIWVDDAAAAVVAALERAPSGVYDVVDDEPLTRDQLAAAMARAAGKRRLHRLPGLLARAMLGGDVPEVLGRSQRVSNRRFKEATGWAPTVPSAREGWRLLAGTGVTAA
ncbi:MAG TPA: NAD-dependent epimerase/dehydratase family protein [Dehalococcoidia bacterium]